MCDPGTAFVIASLATAGVQAYASVQQGNAAYQAGMYNAQIADRNAQSAENEQKNVQDAAAIERRRLGERVRAERGEMIAKYANMGLDTEFGTPADLVGDVQRAYDIDRSILGKNEMTEIERLDRQKADYLDSAAMSRAEAKGARKAGLMGAAGSLLQGAATVSGRWIQPSSTTPATTPSVLTKPKPTTRSTSVLKVGAGG